MPYEFRFCTWNVDYYNRQKVTSEDRVELIRDIDADVVALQELPGRSTRDYEIGPSVFSSEFFPEKDTSSWMICGLVFREGAKILDTGMVPSPYRDQRSLWAHVQLAGCDVPITFVSWHSQHGVKIPAEEKVAFFSAMSEWLAARDGPLVLGADINTWMDPVDLRAADPEDPYAKEHAFVGIEPAHRLRDAYRAMLDESGQLSALRESQPDGPLFQSHRTTPTRRDRIVVSEDFEVVDSGYDTARGFELSDHAPHWAALRMGRPAAEIDVLPRQDPGADHDSNDVRLTRVEPHKTPSARCERAVTGVRF